MLPRREQAVLETSFWTAANRARIEANLLDLFELIVPRAVEAEITQPDSSDPRREYPYATVFRHLRDKMVGPPEGAPAPIALFGPGEADAIALARHLDVLLLVNEQRAGAHARSVGVKTTSVPQVVVLLASLGTISKRAAGRKLELLEPITAATIIAEARLLIERV